VSTFQLSPHPPPQCYRCSGGPSIFTFPWSVFRPLRFFFWTPPPWLVPIPFPVMALVASTSLPFYVPLDSRRPLFPDFSKSNPAEHFVSFFDSFDACSLRPSVNPHRQEFFLSFFFLRESFSRSLFLIQMMYPPGDRVSSSRSPGFFASPGAVSLFRIFLFLSHPPFPLSLLLSAYFVGVFTWIDPSCPPPGSLWTNQSDGVVHFFKRCFIMSVSFFPWHPYFLS